jgi:hypothetical protein
MATPATPYESAAKMPATNQRVVVNRFGGPEVLEIVQDAAVSFRTSARRLNMRCVPRAKAIVTTAGRPSGTAATRRLIEAKNSSLESSPLKKPIRDTRHTRNTAANARSRASRWSDVVTASAHVSRFEAFRLCGPIQSACRLLPPRLPHART